MYRDDRRTVDREHRIPLPLLLYAVLGAPIAWSLHLLTSYFLVALACTTGWSGVVAALLAVTVVFGLAAVGSGVVAYQSWRRLTAAAPRRTALNETGARSSFFMLVGIAMAGVFFLIIVLAGLPPFFLPMCATAVG